MEPSSGRITGRSHHSGFYPFLWIFFLGVHDIQTDVEAKSVIVEADGSVSPELMLEKLLKVGEENSSMFVS